MKGNMENENLRVVEINGVKVEIDLRTAKRVDNFRVGDPVKILVKSYSSYSSHLGMIVGFDEFKSLPTLIVAYIDADKWSDTPLKFHYINAKTEDVEICPHTANDIGVQRSDIINQFEKMILKKEEEIREIKMKRDYFNTMFGKYFETPKFL